MVLVSLVDVDWIVMVGVCHCHCSVDVLLEIGDASHGFDSD